MRKRRTGRGGIVLSTQQLLEGYGAAEECQECGALHCDACYPQRENRCAVCNQRTLRLIMVQYATGKSALSPRKKPVNASRALGAAWAIALRKFLVTQSAPILSIAVAALQLELSQLKQPAGLFGWLSPDAGYRALRTVFATLATLDHEDLTQAVTSSVAAERLLRACGRHEDAESLLLVTQEQRIRLGQSYLMGGRPVQKQLLTEGLRACERCCSIARSLGDTYCEAEYVTRLGNGLYSARRLDDAKEAFDEALYLWQGLAAQEPALNTRVARTLQHLGSLHSARNEHTRAAAAYREAIDLLEALPDTERDLAFTLNNLGNFHLYRREFEQARSSFEHVISVFTHLISSGVTRSTEDPHSPLLTLQLSRARTNLASCQISLGEHDAAEHQVILAMQGDNEQLAHGGDQIRLHLAQCHATLGRITLNRWVRETQGHNGTAPDLLNAAINEYSLATKVYRDQVRQGSGSAHLPQAITAITDFGLALAYRTDLSAAKELIDEASHLSTAPSLWRERMGALDARRAIEARRDNDPLGGFDAAFQAVQVAETGMRNLSDAERANRDLVKARIEPSYLCCIATYARRHEHDETFQMLEALRRIDRLALSHEQTAHIDLSLTAARDVIIQTGFTYLASQAAPKGTIFFAIRPSGAVSCEPAPPGWAARAVAFAELLDRTTDSIRVGEAPGDDLEEHAAGLFEHLPSNIQAALTGDEGPVLFSMGGDQHNLPMEMLYARSHGWLGLRRVCARVRSFEELVTLKERQPTLTPATAVIAAGAGRNEQDTVKILSAARSVQRTVTTAGYTLRPNESILSEGGLQRWKFLDAIDREPSIIVFVGHGGSDRDGSFIALARNDRLRPLDIADLHFDANPLVHLECCVAGKAHYFGGGSWNGYGVATLAAGASCALLSNRIIFGGASDLLCQELYPRLLGPEPLPIGQALLETRQRIAGAYPNPLYWATPILYGNPKVQFRAVS